MNTEEAPGFNARLWRRFISIARPYWISGERGPAWGMFALLMVLQLGHRSRRTCIGRQLT